MADLQCPEKLFSTLPKKRFGRFNQYGISQLGFSVFGDTDIFYSYSNFGASRFGVDHYGDLILLSGIYQTRHSLKGLVSVRLSYYITKNPRYEDQQTNRGKMADAVAGWQALTTEQKSVYNERVKGKNLSGYNLFLREYLSSN
jgi:hypothetical protein